MHSLLSFQVLSRTSLVFETLINSTTAMTRRPPHVIMLASSCPDPKQALRQADLISSTTPFVPVDDAAASVQSAMSNLSMSGTDRPQTNVDTQKAKHVPGASVLPPTHHYSSTMQNPTMGSTLPIPAFPPIPPAPSPTVRAPCTSTARSPDSSSLVLAAIFPRTPRLQAR